MTIDYWVQEKAIIDDDLAECEALLKEVRLKEDMGFKKFLDGIKEESREDYEAYNWHHTL